MSLCAACCVSSHVTTGAANGMSNPWRAGWRACGSWRTEVRLGPVSKNNVEGKTIGEPVWEVIGEIKFNQVANHPGACAELSEKIKWPAAQQAMVFEVNRC
jgi:hypothetical protein